MLAKKTSKNQITLPKAVATRFGGVEYFDVSTDGECIVLRPLQRSRAEEVRARLAQLGVDEEDVATAVLWAREKA
jgi:bifunctional DNA-binding transcriptional regulator/antitoxin component of YhaV-PrlF toxin-antitoxin module